MTKAEIVQRLLEEENITAEEAVVLLQQDAPEVIVIPQQPIAPLQPIIPNEPTTPIYPQPVYPGPFVDPPYPGPFDGDWWRITCSDTTACPNGPGPCFCTGQCKS